MPDLWMVALTHRITLNTQKVMELVPLRRRYRERAVTRARRTYRAMPPVVLVCVYRSRNARRVRALLAQCGEVDARLWALDDPDVSLADLTVGRGPGSKLELVNRLLSEREVPDDAFVVVADDDVVFSRGDLPLCIAEGIAHRFDLFQPSHSWASHFTYRLLVHHPQSLARRTSFVESGPLYVIAPGARRKVLPLPERLGMGWGIEVLWSTLGLRQGVVDTCRIVHLDPMVGTTYDQAAAQQQLDDLLSATGHRTVYDLMVVHERYFMDLG
jgi:hypothetical protein